MDVTAELDTVRRQSREREHECLKLKDEIQVTYFLTMLDVRISIKPIRLFVGMEQIPGLPHYCPTCL